MPRKAKKAKKEKASEIDNAEKRHQSLIEKRNKFNSEARVYREERDALHNQKKKLIEEMKEIRELRGALLKEMREHKSLRNQLQKEAKQLIAFKKKVGVRIHKNLEREIEEKRKEAARLEIKQETISLSLDDENKLLEQIKIKKTELHELEKLFKEQKNITADVDELNAKIDELFKQSDKEHEDVIRLSEEGEKYRERITTSMNEVGVLINEANKKHEKYIKIKERADYYHKRAVEMRGKILSIRKEKRMELEEAKKEIRNQNLEVKKALEDEKELDKIAKASVEKLLKGGKLEL